MAYGEDRDPYGAQMPYNIGYQTYNPNFPAIPGVPNSFASGAYGDSTPYDHYGASTAQTHSGATMGPQAGGSPAHMAGGGGPRQEMVFYGRAGDDGIERVRGQAGTQQYGQAYVQAGRPSSSPPRDSEQHVSPGPTFPPNATPVRRQPAMPQPIGTRRPSQADEFGTAYNRVRTMSGGPNGPQFPSPFRNGARPEMRYLGLTEEHGEMYEVLPSTSNGATSTNVNAIGSSGIGNSNGNFTYDAYHNSIASGNGSGSRVVPSDTFQGLPYFLQESSHRLE